MKIWFLLASVLIWGCKENPCGSDPKATGAPTGAWSRVGFPESATMCMVTPPVPVAMFSTPASGEAALDKLMQDKGYKKLPKSKALTKREFEAAVGGSKSNDVTVVYAKDGDPIRLLSTSSHAHTDSGRISLYPADCTEWDKHIGPEEYCGE